MLRREWEKEASGWRKSEGVSTSMVYGIAESQERDTM